MKRRKLIKGFTLLPLRSLVIMQSILASPRSIHGSSVQSHQNSFIKVIIHGK